MDELAGVLRVVDLKDPPRRWGGPAVTELVEELTNRPLAIDQGQPGARRCPAGVVGAMASRLTVKVQARRFPLRVDIAVIQ